MIISTHCDGRVEFSTNVRQARPSNGHAKFATLNQIEAERGPFANPR
jgi:hypothetical protein